MSFSYTLFLALLLLAPGLGVWAGLRVGERSQLISQAPEKPGSTFSLLVIVFGALIGHLLMAGLLALQASACGRILACVPVSFDPNIYRVILTNGRFAGVPADPAFFVWFLSLLFPTLIVGALSYRASSWRWLRDLREAATFGWLKRWVDLARPPNSFIVAYVVTNLGHEGAHVAYEGIVENIALDDNRSISMLVLSRCDRFLVRISGEDVQRVNVAHAPIPLIQLDARNILNVALEVFEDTAAPDAFTFTPDPPLPERDTQP